MVKVDQKYTIINIMDLLGYGRQQFIATRKVQHLALFVSYELVVVDYSWVSLFLYTDWRLDWLVILASSVQQHNKIQI